MKEFRKKEGMSQMKLAEYCNTSPTYIGEIEVGKKFPSIDMIEKIAGIMKIKPYLFFIDHAELNTDFSSYNIYPKLPSSMKKEIIRELNFSISELIRETIDEY
jgi:transcriptional regulator with XRE-family HTH domain